MYSVWAQLWSDQGGILSIGTAQVISAGCLLSLGTVEVTLVQCVLSLGTAHVKRMIHSRVPLGILNKYATNLNIKRGFYEGIQLMLPKV